MSSITKAELLAALEPYCVIAITINTINGGDVGRSIWWLSIQLLAVSNDVSRDIREANNENSVQ